MLEWVPRDLKKLLREDVPKNFCDEHAKIVLYNMLCAVNFLHSANVMHRDIKSGNILIDDTCSIKLCDFGLSRTLPEESNPLFDTDSVRLKGLQTQPQVPLKQLRRLSQHVTTRFYRSPEIILTQQSYTTKLDVWSLGCVFAEILLMVKAQKEDDPNPR